MAGMKRISDREKQAFINAGYDGAKPPDPNAPSNEDKLRGQAVADSLFNALPAMGGQKLGAAPTAAAPAPAPSIPPPQPAASRPPPTSVVPDMPTPDGVSARDRVDAGVSFGRDWVNKQVTPGVLGRRTDSYRDPVDSLIQVQQENLAGYDSNRMQEAARAQAQALTGGAAAFGNKISGGGARAMAPFAQNAAMQYASGIKADNFDAKARALQAAADYLPKAAGEELAIDQANQGLQQKEATLRATLPFDIAQLLEGTRNGILGNQDADWLLELTKRIRDRSETNNTQIDRAQGR